MFRTILGSTVATSSPLASTDVLAKTKSLDCLPRDTVDCSMPQAVKLATGVLSIHYNNLFGNPCMAHNFCDRYGARTYRHSRAYCDDLFAD